MNYPQLLLIVTLPMVLLLGPAGCDSPPPPSSENGATLLANAECLDSEPATCPGAPIPNFELTDFQPESPRFGDTYGLEEYRGNVTLVALLASW